MAKVYNIESISYRILELDGDHSETGKVVAIWDDSVISKNVFHSYHDALKEIFSIAGVESVTKDDIDFDTNCPGEIQSCQEAWISDDGKKVSSLKKYDDQLPYDILIDAVIVKYDIEPCSEKDFE
jgi:hypothetical protein